MQDALNEIARQRSKDLFKPLRVHFIGEDGIDAGGVKKEFFQLLMTELLSPDYGMLVFQPVSTQLRKRTTHKMTHNTRCPSCRAKEQVTPLYCLLAGSREPFLAEGLDFGLAA